MNEPFLNLIQQNESVLADQTFDPNDPELIDQPGLSRALLREELLQSCRAAFTIRELQALAERAGLENFRIHRHQWFFRMVLEGKNNLLSAEIKS